ncbi:hypothetical protein ACOJUR_01675 [Alicyclobacillus tolerans]|uniref:Uncharacterized protein n=2 Tax=Alicyclobacillus tolerans TaxID=90970 RepID=A0A1M6PP84_9BACL|nr:MULTISPECIES: hypothetical protein [Alicyclobacillus]MDP9729256.1 hypothetical protein [Alicyclobacillus tengchongensis]QRF22299.1 hypothetical protein FY534_00315 [Alicyclobacillus sp. TC]SHK09752.1 hypothetical protein SAMN05443507_10894 [Alicyclobacillus montanus]
MVSMLQLQVTDPGTYWTERERRLLEVLLLRVCAHVNYRVLGVPLRIRPAKIDAIHLLLNYELWFERMLLDEEIIRFEEELARDLDQTLEMCEIQHISVLLKAQTGSSTA